MRLNRESRSHYQEGGEKLPGENRLKGIENVQSGQREFRSDSLLVSSMVPRGVLMYGHYRERDFSLKPQRTV